MLAVVGCGSGGGVPTGTGGSSGTGGTNGTGGTTQTSDYSFTVTPTALSLPPGGMQTVAINIDRGPSGSAFADPITFALEIPNSITGSGVTQTFAGLT